MSDNHLDQINLIKKLYILFIINFRMVILSIFFTSDVKKKIINYIILAGLLLGTRNKVLFKF